MRRRILLICILLASCLPMAPAAAERAWRGEPTLIGGTSRIDRGEWIHTDFVYDDYGADTGPTWGQPNVVSLAPAAGDARYPDGKQFKDNAADIVEVRVRTAENDLEVRVLLQTIVKPSVPAIWVEAGKFSKVFTNANAEIDPAANSVTFTIPNEGTGRSATLNVGAGLNDGKGGVRAGVSGNTHMFPDELTTGGPTGNRLLDLAFNTRKIEGRGGAWNENEQSAALAAGDYDRFAQKIDLEALRSGASTAVPDIRGYAVRLFESRQDLGEGVAGEFPQYSGRWQPYAIWVPKRYDGGRAAPLFLSMHSLSVHHNQYRGGSSPSYRRYYEQFGSELGAVVVTPLGRGPDGWYHDEALIDTLEVWADAMRHYAIDPDRILIGGYSMGGYGTYRLATLMPDSFAAAVSIVGPPANGIWAYPAPPTGGEDSPGFTYPQLENMRHIPVWVTHGAEDELVPVSGVKKQTDRMAELGHEHRFAMHPAADHFSFAFQDEWSREAAWFDKHSRREKNPGYVTFKLRPATWASKRNAAVAGHLRTLVAKLAAQVDGAYWVHDVVAAGKGDVTATVKLLSHGVERRRPWPEQIRTLGFDGPSPHTLTGLHVVIGPALTSDRLSGRLKKVSSLTIDVGRAGLSDSPSLGIKADRTVTITFVRDGSVVGSASVGPSS